MITELDNDVRTSFKNAEPVPTTWSLMSIIDYAIVRPNSILRIQSIKACRGLSGGSDHYV